MSITREITSAGVYYLSCKDEAGNVSNLTSKTFYETNFIMNNNGIISPNKVITLSGNSFILPTPSASSGYTNNGKWYSNNGLTSVVGTYGSNYTPVGNTTLYSTATDVTAPTGNVTANANMNIIDATVNVTDLGSGVKNTYGWRISTSNVCDSSIDTGSAFTTTTTNTYNYVTTYEGVNYLCVRVEDNAGNKNYLLASAIYITANLLSYDNSKTGVNCSTAQCMIDKIAEILN